MTTESFLITQDIYFILTERTCLNLNFYHKITLIYLERDFYRILFLCKYKKRKSKWHKLRYFYSFFTFRIQLFWITIQIRVIVIYFPDIPPPPSIVFYGNKSTSFNNAARMLSYHLRDLLPSHWHPPYKFKHMQWHLCQDYTQPTVILRYRPARGVQK